MWPFRKKIQQLEPLKVNFAIDIAPLLFNIEHELNFVNAMHDVAAIQDEVVKEQFIRRELKSITTKVMNRLADPYLLVLRGYYTDAGLLEYITQLCATKLIAQGMKINMRHISGTNTADISGETDADETEE